MYNTLLISEDHFEGSDKLSFTALAKDMGEGAYYVMETHEDEIINLEMWICDVALFVFDNEFPRQLYVKKSN